MRSDYSKIDPTWTSASPYAFHAASGTAFVTVDGPMFFSMPAGMENYGPYMEIVHKGALVRTIRELADRPDVRAVGLDINSPGGHSYGISDLVDAFAALRAAGKRTSAIAHDQATSHAMVLTSLCDEAVATASACLGSIGTTVDRPIVDDSERWAREGLKAFYPHVGEHKLAGAAGAPLTDDMRASLQRFVESMSIPFHEAVASGRGLTVDAVKALKGAVLSAPDALAAGLIDAIAPFTAWRDGLIATPAPVARDRLPKESAMTDPVSAPPAITTADQLREAYGPLVGQVESAALARAAEPAATVDQLEAAFPSDSAFILSQLKAKATLSAAYRARHDVLAARVVELQARALPGSVGVAAAPTTQAAGAAATPADFAAAARAAWDQAPGNMGRALLAAARAHPGLYAAWHKSGRPAIQFVAD